MVLTRDVWRQCSTEYGLSSDSSSMTSVVFHPLLPERPGGQNFKPWFDKRLFQFSNIVDYNTRRVLPFDTHQAKFSLTLSCYYTYLHIFSFFTTGRLTVSLPTRYEKLHGSWFREGRPKLPPANHTKRTNKTLWCFGTTRLPSYTPYNWKYCIDAGDVT